MCVLRVRRAGASAHAGSELRQCVQRKKLLPQFEAFHEREGYTSVSASLYTEAAGSFASACALPDQ
jgi:hypothetical protein